MQDAAPQAVREENGHGVRVHRRLRAAGHERADDVLDIRLDDRERLLANGPADRAVHIALVLRAEGAHLALDVAEKAQQRPIGLLLRLGGKRLKVLPVGLEEVVKHIGEQLVLRLVVIVEQADLAADLQHNAAHARAVIAVLKDLSSSDLADAVLRAALDHLLSCHRECSFPEQFSNYSTP